jgi:hypothetical protein
MIHSIPLSFSEKGYLPFFCLFILFFIVELNQAHAQLPQDHAYQDGLRDYMGTLSESDFEVNLSSLTVEDSISMMRKRFIRHGWFLDGVPLNCPLPMEFA